ncbi:MAG: MobF family relaxase [Mycobacteriales bacterium]|nr:MobF family relaxase [Mycobacteriales bacterium]
MLSIGRLAPGRAAANYFLERVGCPLDYFVGSGELAGRWIGDGARAMGLDGELSSPDREEDLRRLLEGRAPDGTELVGQVLRSDPRSRVPTAVIVAALQREAQRLEQDVEDLWRPVAGGTEPTVVQASGRLAEQERLAKLYRRAQTDLDRARRRPRWPAPTMSVDDAERLLRAARLNPTQALAERTPCGRLRDRFAKAVRHRDDRVDVRIPGLDLTFSAPKSVSVLYALAPDSSGDGAADLDIDAASSGSGQTGRMVREAHRLAVTEALAYLELQCATALRGHHRGDGSDTRIGSEGFIGAAFEHRSSRCGDPQLHTHVVIANLLHGRDGKWSAIDTREIYAHARTAGFVYQAVLRGELTRTLGVTWGPVRNGQADIAGIPQPLLRLFSKRRTQIEEQLERVGLDGPAAAQAATLSTRPDKPTAEDAVRLQDRWQQEAAAAGYDRDVTRAVLHQDTSGQLRQLTRDAQAAVGPMTRKLADDLLEPTGLTLKRASFDRKELLRGVCEHLPAGVPVRLAGLRALATRVLHDERIVPLLGDAPVSARRYSTRELLALEHDALEIAQRLTHAGPPVTTVPACLPVRDATLDAAKAAAQARGLSDQQQAMLERLLTGDTGLEVIVGAAGSGKTAALAVAAEAWRASGIPVQGAALAAIAARVLQDSAGIPAQSLQRLLNQTDPTPVTGGAQVRGRLEEVLPPGGVLVIDEAGMVGTRTLHRLLTLAEQTGTKLVLVGDPKQLPEIDAGGLFASLAQRLPTVELTGNQRQQAKWEQRALRELRGGDVLRALSAYSRHQRLRVTDTIESLTSRLLDDYETHLRSHTPDRVLVIASSRGDARRLNAQLRQRMLEHGRLGPEELRVPLAAGGHRGYRTGEQVLVTANDYPLGLLNGTRASVTTLHPDDNAVTVRLDDGRTLHLDQTYLRTGRLTHGYALTAHKAQGITVDVSLLWGTHALTRETGYVAMSRGRERNYLYSTWDLLSRDTGLTDTADLDRPAVLRRPDDQARKALTRAGIAERLAATGRQRTARSWWRPSPTASVWRTREPAQGTEPPGGVERELPPASGFGTGR